MGVRVLEDSAETDTIVRVSNVSNEAASQNLSKIKALLIRLYVTASHI